MALKVQIPNMIAKKKLPVKESSNKEHGTNIYQFWDMLRRAREKNNCILNKVQEEAFSCETFPDRLTKAVLELPGKGCFLHFGGSARS